MHDRTQEARARDVHLAFAMEYMARQKTIGPDTVRRLLSSPTRHPQTRAEHQAVFAKIAATIGGPTQRLIRSPEGRWIPA